MSLAQLNAYRKKRQMLYLSPVHRMPEPRNVTAHRLDPWTGAPLTQKGRLEDGYGVSDPGNDSLGVPGKAKSVAKRYAEHRAGIHLHLKVIDRATAPHVDAHELCALFYRPVSEVLSAELSPVASADLNRDLADCGDHWRQEPMFVDVVDVVEEGERVPRWVCSMVRLQSLDFRDPERINAPEAISDSTCPVLVVFDEWERRAIRWPALPDKDQLPDEVVQARAQVAPHITVDERQLYWRPMMNGPAVVIGVAIRVELIGEAIGFTIKEFAEDRVEGFEMRLGLVELCPDSG